MLILDGVARQKTSIYKKKCCIYHEIYAQESAKIFCFGFFLGSYYYTLVVLTISFKKRKKKIALSKMASKMAAKMDKIIENGV